MADRDQTARGPQTRTLNFYTKRGELEWGGMIPDGNPAANPPNRPRYVQNARFQNGEIVARGGQALHAAVIDPTVCVKSLFDLQMSTRRGMYAFAFGCPGIAAPGLAFSIIVLDVEQEPEVQTVFYGNATARNLTAESYSNNLYFARDRQITRFQPINQPYGADAFEIGGDRQDISLFSLPTAYTHVNAMKGFDGRMFLAADGGAGASAVVPFDGRTFGPIDLDAINPPVGFGLYRESLLMGFDGAPNSISVRAAGAPPGSWASVAPSGGTARWGRAFSGSGSQASGSGNGAGVSYKDLFWLASGTPDVFKYNGTTLTQVPPATTGIAAGSITVAFAVFNRVLYLLYESGGAGGNICLASYDGTTWTPIVINLTTYFTASFTTEFARNLAVYRGELFVLIRSTGAPAGTRGRILYAVGGDVATWGERDLGLAGGVTDYAYALVY